LSSPNDGFGSADVENQAGFDIATDALKPSPKRISSEEMKEKPAQLDPRLKACEQFKGATHYEIWKQKTTDYYISSSDVFHLYEQYFGQ